MENLTLPQIAATAYRPRPTSRKRRTPAQMDDIRDAICRVLAAGQPMTVRQTYYQLVHRGVIEKTEAEYKTTVVRLLTEMRRDHIIPFGWIADSTRWMRKPRTYHSIEQMLEFSQQTYRRSIWNDQQSYVEVWLEKDATPPAPTRFVIDFSGHTILMAKTFVPAILGCFYAVGAGMPKGYGGERAIRALDRAFDPITV